MSFYILKLLKDAVKPLMYNEKSNCNYLRRGSGYNYDSGILSQNPAFSMISFLYNLSAKQMENAKSYNKPQFQETYYSNNI